MRVYKDRQYLIFDYEDGRTVKYDFATKTAIGIKGNPDLLEIQKHTHIQ